jgi:hypothetical protein
MKISEVQIGQKLNHGVKGEMTVINVTKRTITVSHKFGTTKVTYRSSDVNVSVSDF